MKRPNRYPYTRSQWVKESRDFFINQNEKYLTVNVLENRITGEIKS